MRSLATESQAAGYTTAFGEIGLDYDRLQLTGKEQQLKYFEQQLDLAVELQLPLFLHSRAASEDFERLLAPRLAQLPKKGLVHSFTGTLEEMQRLVALNLDIGVNGCSLKTEENLEVVRHIPLERIQIETDGPWVSCETDFVVLDVPANWTRSTVRDARLACLCEAQNGCPAAAQVRQEGKVGAKRHGQRTQ